MNQTLIPELLAWTALRCVLESISQQVASAGFVRMCRCPCLKVQGCLMHSFRRLLCPVMVCSPPCAVDWDVGRPRESAMVPSAHQTVASDPVKPPSSTARPSPAAPVKAPRQAVRVRAGHQAYIPPPAFRSAGSGNDGEVDLFPGPQYIWKSMHAPIWIVEDGHLLALQPQQHPFAVLCPLNAPTPSQSTH